MSRLESLKQRLEPLKAALLDHPLHQHVNDLASLHLFMEHHVFAVWDFMSLLKALQRVLTCVAVPWLPSHDPFACRLVNEIVLAEESDDDGRGGFASHLDLYRRSMIRCQASTAALDAFLAEVRHGATVQEALALPEVPGPARDFVLRTFAVIAEGELSAVASAFTFGREELLPDLFRRVVDALDAQTGGTLEDFRYYLNRHIGLDAEEHGPMAGQLVVLLCGESEARWQAAERAAVLALEARKDLWDGILAAVRPGAGAKPGFFRGEIGLRG